MKQKDYPTYWDDEDRANYIDLITRGQALIGKTLSKNDDFLIDMSATITINQMKGYSSNVSPAEIEAQMLSHQEALKYAQVYTPENMYEEGQHPLELSPAVINEPHDNEEEKEKHAYNLDLIQ